MGIVYDIDGNAYNTVVIGTQEWIIENLKTTKYADGTLIPTGLTDMQWIAEDGSGGHDGAYSYPDFNVANKSAYGLLYNWFAANNAHGFAYLERGGVQEVGWRIPTDTDWSVLITAVGGNYMVAGGYLKDIGFTHWTNLPPVSPSYGGGSDLYGFKAYGSGDRCDTGENQAFMVRGFFWCSTEDTGLGYSANFDCTWDRLDLVLDIKRFGFSVRLVRDYVPMTTDVPATTIIPTTTLLPTTTQVLLMRGVTISQKAVTRVTSTDLVPFVTFSINPGLGGCYEFLDMFINSTYKPSSVVLSLDRDFTDPSTVLGSKITTYNPGWFYIHGFPKTVGNKVLEGKILFVKILFDNKDLFYDLRLVKTGFRELLGG
jgi:Fibrobacter succinogenes major domain (Fib_succ_major).